MGHDPQLDEGESAASALFDRLYRAQAPQLLAYVARRVPADGVADVVADTFAVAWRRLSRVPADDPLPWLLGVARRVIANQHRSRRRREALVQRLAGQPPFEPDQASAGLLLTEVVAALRELPERDREALRLAAWEGLTARQAGQVLGCSATAYRLRLHRARRKLAARLNGSADSQQRESVLPTLHPEELP
jgi:RNA polymerase sigma-70 factor (ECF subfamily)